MIERDVFQSELRASTFHALIKYLTVDIFSKPSYNDYIYIYIII